MAELNCEIVCMAAMAIADGYQPELSSDQIETHLASCVQCRSEVGEQQALSSLLDAQKRRLRAENVWRQVELRLPETSTTQSTSQGWHALMLLGGLLLTYRIAEMIPDRDFGLVFKLVPVLLVIAAFTYLRENPFTINTELRLEGE
ncbi:MAG: hypothetical protein ACRD8U_04725 [Pyrinomonadaceae bacterium]